jgi:uncharacterized protein (TIGR02646 family)
LILLKRERTTAGIPAGFRGQKRVTRARELLELHKTLAPPKSSVWSAAKPRLKRESGGKCGYCEGKADHVAHGDVEHFRPKSVYWWLAYCYDNYVYACQICNQTYKGTNFPREGAMLPAPAVAANATDGMLDAMAPGMTPDPLDQAGVDAFHAAALAEKPGLPDPYNVDPEPLFSWRPDGNLREVEIRPRDNSQRARKAFKAVEQYLGLNRQELLAWRYEVYDTADLLVQSLKSPALDAPLKQRIEAKLQLMMSVEGEFAAMVRYLVRDVEGLQL